LSENAEEFAAEPEAEQQVEASDERATASVQNEPIASADSKEEVADARQIRAEYSPTLRSTAAQLAGDPAQREVTQWHEEGARAENTCYEERRDGEELTNT
jgi:hypothetical protein